MSKVYKGYELLKAIADGEIKEGSRFIDTYSEYIYRKDGIDEELTLYKKDEITGAYSTPDYSYFVDNKNDFELIEEDTINIDSIEEINHYDVISAVEGKTEENINDELKSFSLEFNKILKWAKQADKEIKSIKEK